MFEDLRELFIDSGVCTEEELDLVGRINGFTVDTLEDILYVRTGKRDVYEYLGWNNEEYED